MTIDEVYDMWKVDAVIDKSILTDESLGISKLHHKWARMHSIEKLSLKKMEAYQKRLKHAKSNFYQDGPNEGTRKLGWEMPAKGRIMKTELNGYLEADKDLIDYGLLVAEQAEVVDALAGIVKMITNRGYNIRDGIDFLRYEAGQ